jgi:hypothetical protein
MSCIELVGLIFSCESQLATIFSSTWLAPLVMIFQLLMDSCSNQVAGSISLQVTKSAAVWMRGEIADKK